MVLGVWTRSGFWSPHESRRPLGSVWPPSVSGALRMPGALRMLAAVFGGIQHLHLKGAKRSPKPPYERISRPSWGSERHRSGGTGADPAAGCAPTASSPPSAAMQSAGQGCVLGPLCAGDSPKQPRSKETNGKRSRRSATVSWAWLDFNQRPHPYQVSRAKRCADRRFPRSRMSVRGVGKRSNTRIRDGRAAVAVNPIACRLQLPPSAASTCR
jgi:hypothetical protein